MESGRPIGGARHNGATDRAHLPFYDIPNVENVFFSPSLCVCPSIFLPSTINEQKLDGVVTRIQPRRPRNRGSIPTRDKIKGKGKVHPRTGHEGPEGDYRYCSTISLTSALNGVGVLGHAPAASNPGTTGYTLYRRLGGAQGPPGRVWKTLPHRDSIPGPSSL